jgi:hypothetical protein
LLPARYALLNPAFIVEAAGWFGYKRTRGSYYKVEKMGNGLVHITTKHSHKLKFDRVLKLSQDKRAAIVKRVSG